MFNYEECWENLRSELLALSLGGVRTIDPEIVLAYMRFIEQREEYHEEFKKADAEEAGA